MRLHPWVAGVPSVEHTGHLKCHGMQAATSLPYAMLYLMSREIGFLCSEGKAFVLSDYSYVFKIYCSLPLLN